MSKLNLIGNVKPDFIRHRISDMADNYLIASDS
jgi:hypothetical protein